MEAFGKFMAVLLILIISPIIHGFVIVKLWAWFIVPTFNTEPLRIVEAIGIMLLISYIKSKRTETKDKDFWEELGKNIVFAIFIAIFALTAGWIISKFM